MGTMRSICVALALAAVLSGGCSSKVKYGRETPLALPGETRQTWAVAPVISLSGQASVDPILQADLLYQQLQEVQGLNVIPVNRVAEVYRAMGIAQVQSEAQAAIACDLLGCDALVVASITAYDPFDPPKIGGALLLLRRGDYRRPANVDVRELARRAAPTTATTMPSAAMAAQAVGMFDAANGSTREAALAFAAGRNDPTGPYRSRIVLIEMDRYARFVYHELIATLLDKLGGAAK